MDLIDQLLVLHPEPVVQFVMDQFCKLFSNEIREVCNEFVTIYGPTIISGLESFENADAICHSMNLCADANCRLFPTMGEPDFDQFVANRRRYSLRNIQPPADSPGPQSADPMVLVGLAENLFESVTSAVSSASRPLHALLETLRDRMDASWARTHPKSPRDSPWDWIIELIDRLASYHLPLVDVDGDHMSLSKGLRGSNWRGRDCNDLDSTMCDISFSQCLSIAAT